MWQKSPLVFSSRGNPATGWPVNKMNENKIMEIVRADSPFEGGWGMWGCDGTNSPLVFPSGGNPATGWPVNKMNENKIMEIVRADSPFEGGWGMWSCAGTIKHFLHFRVLTY